MKTTGAFTTFLFLTLGFFNANAQENNKIEALILMGLDYHDVEKQAKIYEQILKATGEYDVTTYYVNQNKNWSEIDLDFSRYDIIVSPNLGIVRDWPDTLKSEFESYIFNGGNLAIVHQGVGSQQDWPKFHEIIGMGFYKFDAGEHLFWDEANQEWIKTPSYIGVGAGHGKQHEFKIQVRNTNHPITQDMPTEWMHGMDELYHGMRGPLKNVNVLMTAYSEKQTWGSGDHEPIAWTVNYGQGRIFTTVLGHLFLKERADETSIINPYENETKAMYCTGYQTLFARGVEWAATGNVSTGIPENFPTSNQASIVLPESMEWKKKVSNKK